MDAGFSCSPAWIIGLTLCVGMCSIAAFGQGIYIPKDSVKGVNVSLTSALASSDEWPNAVYLSADPAGDVSFPDGTEVPLTSANVGGISVSVKGEQASGSAGGTKISASDADDLVSGEVALTVFSVLFVEPLPWVELDCGGYVMSWSDAVTVSLKPNNAVGHLKVWTAYWNEEFFDWDTWMLADGQYSGGNYPLTLPTGVLWEPPIYAEWTINDVMAMSSVGRASFTFNTINVSIAPEKACTAVSGSNVQFTATGYFPGGVDWVLSPADVVNGARIVNSYFDPTMPDLSFIVINPGSVAVQYEITATPISDTVANCNDKAILYAIKVDIAEFDRVAPTKTNQISVTTTPSPLPAGCSITLACETDAGTTGSATVSPATVNQTTTVTITGGTQSWGSGANAARNNIKLNANLNGSMCASEDFTVCAHAYNFAVGVIFSANLQFGFENIIEWESDSDFPAHLDQVEYNEVVWTYDWAEPFSYNYSDTIRFPSSSGWGIDRHYAQFQDPPYYDGAYSRRSQIWSFKCRRCGQDHGFEVYGINRDIWQAWTWKFRTEVVGGPGGPLSQVEAF